MSERFSEELISAYLDGELTAAEREAVERALRDDPESQRLLEDFRALRARLQSLPRPALGEDFHREVLQRAERAMLAAPVTPSTVEQKTSDTHSGGGGSNGRNWRRWMWPSLAVAAALLVMAFQQFGHEPEQAVVQRSPQSSSSGSIGALHDQDALAEFDAGALAGSEEPAADAIAISPAQPSRARGVDGTDGVASGRLPREESSPPAEPAAPRTNRPQLESLATDDRMLRQRSVARDEAPPEPRLGEAAAPAPDTLATESAVAESSPAQSESLPNVYLVEVSQTADAARRRTFERVLATEGIPLTGDAVITGGAAASSAAGARTMAEAEELAERQSRSKLSVQEASDWFYVEAGADKVQRVLTTLDARKDSFPSVLLQLDPGAAERQLQLGAMFGGQAGAAAAQPRTAGSEQLSTSNFGGQGEARYQVQPLQRRAVPFTQDADADVASRPTNEPAANADRQDAEFARGESNRELAFSRSYADPRGPAAGEVPHGPPAPVVGEALSYDASGELLGRAVRLRAVNPEARPESLLSRNGVADSVLTESRGRGGFGVSPQQVEGQQQLGQGQQASAQPADDANAAAPPEPQSSAAKPLRVLFRLRVADPHGPPEPTRP